MRAVGNSGIYVHSENSLNANDSETLRATAAGVSRANKRGRTELPPRNAALTCPVCTEEITREGDRRAASLKCGHVFCHECLLEWFCRNNEKCPQCGTSAKRKHIRLFYADELPPCGQQRSRLSVDDTEKALTAYAAAVVRYVPLYEKLQTHASLLAAADKELTELNWEIDMALLVVKENSDRVNRLEEVVDASGLQEGRTDIVTEEVERAVNELGPAKSRLEKARSHHRTLVEKFETATVNHHFLESETETLRIEVVDACKEFATARRAIRDELYK